jgi:hypothetical protein
MGLAETMEQVPSGVEVVGSRRWYWAWWWLSSARRLPAGRRPTSAASHHQLAPLPWRAIPIADHTATTATAGPSSAAARSPPSLAGFPHAAQAIRITRRVRPLVGQRWRTVTVSAVTNLTAAPVQPVPSRTGGAATGNIEALHTSAPSPSPRTPPRAARQHALGHGQPVQPLAIGILRLHGRHNLAAAPRRPRRQPSPATARQHRPMHQPLRHAAEALGAGQPDQAGKEALLPRRRRRAQVRPAPAGGIPRTRRRAGRASAPAGARGRGIPRNRPQEPGSRHGFPASGRRSAQAVAALAGHFSLLPHSCALALLPGGRTRPGGRQSGRSSPGCAPHQGHWVVVGSSSSAPGRARMTAPDPWWRSWPRSWAEPSVGDHDQGRRGVSRLSRFRA